MSITADEVLNDGQYAPAYLVAELDGQPVYWYPPDDQLVVNREIVQEVDMDGRTPDEYLAYWINDYGYPPLTDLGNFFANVAPLRDVSVFSDQQRIVYAMRDILDVDREEAAKLLDVAPNTIDNHRSKAKRKVTICCSVATAVAKKNDVDRIRVQ